jgi:hypothetical protein
MKEDAVDMLWKQVKHKLPGVQLAVHRNRRLEVPDWWRRRRMIPELSYTTLYIHNIFSSCTLITLYGNNLRQLQSPPVIICHYTESRYVHFDKSASYQRRFSFEDEDGQQCIIACVIFFYSFPGPNSSNVSSECAMTCGYRHPEFSRQPFLFCCTCSSWCL